MNEPRKWPVHRFGRRGQHDHPVAGRLSHRTVRPASRYLAHIAGRARWFV